MSENWSKGDTPFRRFKLHAALLASMLAAFAAGSTALASEAGRGYEITWHTTDTGGDNAVTAGDYELDGTIGQPDAAVVAAGDYELTGGFWLASTPDTDGIPTVSAWGMMVMTLLVLTAGSLVFKWPRPLRVR